MLDQLMQEVKEKKSLMLDGKSAFILYDTYGFPLDLTRLILRENGLDINQEEFEREMSVQKNRSRDAATLTTDEWQEIFPSEATTFLGYDLDSAEIRISRFRKVELKGKPMYHLVFDQTPFYAESGGQVGDSGVIEHENEMIHILDTQKENNLIVHSADKLPVKPEIPYIATVNHDARTAAARHHTATHLLHHALRTVLGTCTSRISEIRFFAFPEGGRRGS